MDQNQDRHRGHFRSRRGHDRQRHGRRPPQQPPQERQTRDQVDVEQIMREIRGRIAQRQGIDLSNQQIQDLAARKLESILDPRAVKPSLLEGIRRAAAVPTDVAPTIPNEPVYSFEDSTIYDSHRGLLRLARKLFNPFLKLLFNPNPLIRALHLQAKLNVETAERNAERDRRQAEWNALHYEIVQRMVTEVARVSLELQALSLRVEALGARVEFNDRRVSSVEGLAQRFRPQNRPADTAASAGGTPDAGGSEPASSLGDAQSGDAARRRRRRRRGRRNGLGSGDSNAESTDTSGRLPSQQVDSNATEESAEEAADAEQMTISVAPSEVEAAPATEAERIAEPSPPLPEADRQDDER
jgi:hypothetical protein